MISHHMRQKDVRIPDEIEKDRRPADKTANQQRRRDLYETIL